MRFLVELQYSYISFDESEEEKAWEIYREQGKRIFKCEDLFDEGILLAGPPIFRDLSLKDENNEESYNNERLRNSKQFN